MNARKFINISAVFLISYMAGIGQQAHAMLLDLADTPLIAGISVRPNIFLLIDDSVTMNWEVLTTSHWSSCRYSSEFSQNCSSEEFEPDGTTQSNMQFVQKNGSLVSWPYYSDTVDNVENVGCPGFDGPSGAASSQKCINSGQIDPIDQDWRFTSTSLNLMMFNPNREYLPWRGFAPANFNAARSNPQPGTNGFPDTENLNGFEYAVWIDDKGYSGSQPLPDASNMTNEPNGEVDLWDTHIRVKFNNGSPTCQRVEHQIDPNTSILDRVIAPISCPTEATGGQSISSLQQNLANWYQYHRRRMLEVRGALIDVLAQQPDLRYGIGVTKDISQSFVTIPDRIFSSSDIQTQNQAVLDLLLNNEFRNERTKPLRQALDITGQYFAGATNVPGRPPSPIIESCQKNFAVMFTDGLWSGTNFNPGYGDRDGDNAQEPGSGNNTSSVTTLADVALQYYDKDLRPDLADEVPADSFDDNQRQHMVTFTIGLGINPSLVDSDDDGWPNPLLAEGSSAWWNGAPADGAVRRSNDLWHAAFNGHGLFINVTKPEDIVEGLLGSINNIALRVGSAASGATNGGSITTESRVFQAKFFTEDWHGALESFRVQNDGSLATSPEWEAGALLDTKSNGFLETARRVFTYNPDSNTGKDFTWGSLSTNQQLQLDTNPGNNSIDGLGRERLLHLRGSRRNEAPDGLGFRDREFRLGDIVNSTTEFVGAPNLFLPDINYQAFFQANRNRTQALYVGANDGMLHAFRADAPGDGGGEELFAYVPNAVFSDLNKLTSRNYRHRFYIDGSPTAGDAQINGSWRTILAGGLRAGGQGVFALDITNPDTFSAANVLWEFTDADDADLGFSFSDPQIVKMNNDEWAVIIGNGYNNTATDDHVSTNGDASLFILFLDQGIDGFQTADFVKLRTNSGTLDNPNGLSSANVADIDGDGKVDYIYAGDLQGNMWQFDVSSKTAGSWKVGFNGQPLFTAEGPAGELQPITAAPTAIAHPLGTGQGALILFGTGKFIENSDTGAINTPLQSFYAIWDRSVSPNPAIASTAGSFNNASRSQLAKVQLGTSGSNRFIDDTTSEEPDWFDANGDPLDRGWMVDLPDPGERVIRETIVRNNIVFFVTLIPSDDRCAPGGTGFLMALATATGGSPADANGNNTTVFDVNGDAVFDEFDNVAGKVVVGLEQSGIPTLPAVIFDPRSLCERNPAAPQCQTDDDTGTGGVGLGAPFPPPLNSARGCGSDGTRIYLYTTTSNGDITEATASLADINCGRQAWRQRR
ncbi:MAG: PilC/PilY family type IV pilus protein [Gammaproteobacteria bacterium]|nr:PilC/PilY family type IV pilus protein [Gammaproteobacteria bacterium]